MWGHMWGPMMGASGWDAATGWWMMLPGLLVWGSLLVVGVWAVKQFAQSPAQRQDTPLTILQERFARGEINKEQFEETKQVLVGR